MRIFKISKLFPKEETYSLNEQIRKSSRSIAVTIAEAHRKRICPKYFLSKLTDSDSENSATQTWLDFALACNYINEKIQVELI